MRAFLALFLNILVFFSLSAANQLPFHSVKNINEFVHFADSSIILEDKESKLTFQEVLELDNSEFSPTNSDIPYMDFTKSTFWMKLNLKHDTSDAESYYIQLARPLTNIVNLYIFNEHNELIKAYNAGDDLPFYSRPYQNKKFVFPYKFGPNVKLKLLIQAKSDGEILKLPIKIWDVQAFTQYNANENFYYGLYYGFISFVIILFTFFGIALRQRIYFFFVSYVILFGLFQFSLDGFSYKFLWSNNPYLGNHSILIFAALSMLSLLFYANQFLLFSKAKKWFYRTYQVFCGLVIICFINSLTTGFLYEITFPILNLISFLCTTLFFIGIYLRYRSGNNPGIAIALAFAFLWIGAICFILSNVNIIPSEFLATNALKIASAIEIAFLSISLAARYRRTQTEKIEAEKAANKILKEINELKEEQTEKLEKQVAERTTEIKSKNIALEIKNKEVFNSITYAKRLQDALLPSDELRNANFKESSIFFLPKDIVSGDFYWMETTPEHIYFAVADCTGHGVPGAMVSVVGFNALNRCINELHLKEPAKILDKLTELVEHTFENTVSVVSDGMDICLCRWDYKSELVFAGAFNPLYLIRNNDIEEIKGDKQPIGKFVKRTDFKSHKIHLTKGDSIILFSDGYADQFGGPKGKKLKYTGFKEQLLSGNKLPIDEFNSHLSTFFNEWKGDEEQIDDVCVMTVRF